MIFAYVWMLLVNVATMISLGVASLEMELQISKSI